MRLAKDYRRTSWTCFWRFLRRSRLHRTSQAFYWISLKFRHSGPLVDIYHYQGRPRNIFHSLRGGPREAACSQLCNTGCADSEVAQFFTHTKGSLGFLQGRSLNELILSTNSDRSCVKTRNESTTPLRCVCSKVSQRQKRSHRDGLARSWRQRLMGKRSNTGYWWGQHSSSECSAVEMVVTCIMMKIDLKQSGKMGIAWSNASTF